MGLRFSISRSKERRKISRFSHSVARRGADIVYSCGDTYVTVYIVEGKRQYATEANVVIVEFPL